MACCWISDACTKISASDHEQKNRDNQEHRRDHAKLKERPTRPEKSHRHKRGGQHDKLNVNEGNLRIEGLPMLEL